MALQVTPYTLPLAVCGVVFAAFAGYVLRRPARRHNRETLIAAFLLLAMAAWLLLYVGALSFTTRAEKLVFARLQWVGPTAVPALWFAYVLAFTGHGDLLDRRRAVALAVPPVVVFALVASFPATGLVWQSATLTDAGSWTALTTEHGVAFYAYQLYVYGLFGVSLWLLVRHYRRAASVYRRQTLALLVGALVPGVVGLLYVADLSPAPELDLPAISLVATAGAVGWSVVSDDLFTLAPIAWETAVGQLDDPVFVVDTDQRVVAANEAARAFADVTIGESAADALGDALDERHWRDPGEYEVDVFRDGATRVYDVSVTPVERRGSRLGNVLVVRDVTERHRREERLEEFASVVSHDLRNPLNVARGHLELGRETGDDAHFAETDEALGRMERIIEDLLALAREGDAEPEGEAQSLAACARTAWGAVDSLDPDAALEIEADRTVVADETALLRLLENLFRNAVEHGSTDDENAEVAVTVGATEDGFFVADNGPGIPEDERDTVFDRGYTTSVEGTGFGLAIVRAVAESHDWTVAVAESESGGARFDVTVE